MSLPPSSGPMIAYAAAPSQPGPGRRKSCIAVRSLVDPPGVGVSGGRRMSHTNDPAGRPSAPSVTDLFARYLEQQIDAHAGGLGYPEPGDHATPFDVAPVQPVDPQLAWKDAT